MRKALYLCSLGEYIYSSAGRIVVSSVLDNCKKDFDIIWFVDDEKTIEEFKDLDMVEFRVLPRVDIENYSTEYDDNHFYGFCMKTMALQQFVKSKEYDRLVFLDMDVVVQCDINELFDLDMGDKSFAAYSDCLCNEYKSFDAPMAPKMCFVAENPESKFACSTSVNAGVMVFDLTKIDDIPDFGELVELRKYDLPDQWYINEVFRDWRDNDIYHLDRTYNHINDNIKLFSTFTVERQLKEREKQKRAKIVHYRGLSKPWKSLGRKSVAGGQEWKMDDINGVLTIAVEPWINYYAKVSKYIPKEYKVEIDKHVDILHQLGVNKTPMCYAPFMARSIGTMAIGGCCEVTDFYGNDMKEAWNHEKVRELRKAMWNHDMTKVHERCVGCLKSKGYMQRQYMEKHFDELRYSLPNDFNVETGEIPESYAVNVQIYPSNVCTSACRMCGSQLSTGVKTIRDKIGVEYEPDDCVSGVVVGKNNVEALNSEHARVFGILGGNPQDDDTFPDNMNLVLKMKNLRRFFAITNGNKTTCTDGESIFKKMKRVQEMETIEQVSFTVSIDGTKDVHEYQRVYNKFDRAVDFAKEAVYNGIKVDVNYTVTNINVLRTAEYIEWHMENLQPLGIDLLMNTVEDPKAFAPYNIPRELKMVAVRKLLAVRKKYNNERVHEMVSTIVKVLTRNGTDIQWQSFVSNNAKYDKYQNKSLVDLVPEFKGHMGDTIDIKLI